MTTAIRLIEREEWRILAPTFLDYSYRHLWDFGVACATRLGATSEHIAIKQGGNIVGIADVRIKKIPGLYTGIAYINCGPMVRKDADTDSERLRFCLDVLVDKYVKKRGLVLRILAPVGPPTWNDIQTSIFTEMGFVPARARRYRTFLLDINKPLEEIRKNLAQKWRNCLNSAEKKRITIRTDTSTELFAEFCSLYEQLIQRKQFDDDLGASFYSRVQVRLDSSERFCISIADIEGKVAAGHVSSMLGDTCVYVLGASNEEGLRSKASYVLQWHVIQEARKQGCRWYDLCGINPQTNPSGYHFKKGLGGIDITAPGPFELSPSRLKAYFVAGSEHLYRIVRRVFRPGQ